MNTKTTKTRKNTKRIVGASAAPRGKTAIMVPTKLVNKVSGFLGKDGDINAFTGSLFKGIVSGANA